MTESERHSDKSDEPIDHTDPDTLRYLYHEQEWSTIEIADAAGVKSQTVCYHMEKHGIERRTSAEARRVEYADYRTGRRGYEYWQDSYSGGGKVYVHRLLAVALYGYDEVVDSEVHHENEIKWANWPDNIDIMSTADHRREHIDLLNG